MLSHYCLSESFVFLGHVGHAEFPREAEESGKR